ncbi:hypothetical protein AAEX28_06670 [Lentisphaerota bacterium WC36G]|nr:hypothetical protein LJT99_09535 [Lentisphaerae bacterium WC36]
MRLIIANQILVTENTIDKFLTSNDPCCRQDGLALILISLNKLEEKANYIYENDLDKKTRELAKYVLEYNKKSLLTKSK